MQSPQDPRPFFKNMLKSTFKTKVGNPEEISSPVVEAIRENTEAIKDKDVAKQMSKPIVSALVDVMEKIEGKRDSDEGKIDKLLERIETVKGEPGNDGHTPTKEELIPIIEPLIKPLIPDPIPGEDGKDYVLTSKDKKEIAKSIEVPIVERIVETIIEKQPIVTNEIKEVAVAEEAPKIKEKLESLEGDERLDAKAIKNLPKTTFGGGGGIKRIDAANDTRIISPTNGQTLVWNSTRQVWENSTPSGGSGDVATDVIWDAKGDLAVGTGDNAASRLAVGTNGQVLTADSGEATGVKWATPGSGTGTVDSIVAGNNIDVDATDPANPIVSVETLTLADISDVTASATEVNYTDGVTSAIQTQLNAKQDTLVSATNIKTINSTSLLGAGDIVIAGGSGISRAIVSSSGSFTAGATAATDYVYLITGAHAVALPTAVSNTNRYTFKNNHSAAITITPNGAETLEGAASIQIAPEDAVDIISNNSNWFII